MLQQPSKKHNCPFTIRVQEVLCFVGLKISWALGSTFEIVIAAFIIPRLGWRWLLVFSAIPCLLIVILQYKGSRGNIKDLFSRTYRRTTMQLWLLWFVTAFCCYGMVLASSEILQLHNAKQEGWYRRGKI